MLFVDFSYRLELSYPSRPCGAPCGVCLGWVLSAFILILEASVCGSRSEVLLPSSQLMSVADISLWDWLSWVGLWMPIGDFQNGCKPSTECQPMLMELIKTFLSRNGLANLLVFI